MNDRRPASHDLLSDPAAKQLLARASELDAAGSSVADLRAAATEAGISAQAFDAALAEMREAHLERTSEPVEAPRRRSRLRETVIYFVVVVVIGLAIFRLFPSPVTTPTSETTILLRCLTTVQATNLLRPQLDPLTTITASPERAPGVLTIVATQAELQKIRSLLDQYERPGSASCPAAPRPQ